MAGSPDESGKPLVLVDYLEADDKERGIPEREERHLRERFRLISLAELARSPDDSLLGQIEGICGEQPALAVGNFLELIPRMPCLKGITFSGVGTDAYYSTLKPLGVPLANTPTAVTQGTANYALTLILCTGTDVIGDVDLMMRTDPPMSSPDAGRRAPGVVGSTLGIVGMGRIGYATARRAFACDMKILYHNRSRRPKEDEQLIQAEYCPSLNDMLPRCDYVLISCPLTADTRFLFDKNRLQLMKNSAALINVARGHVVNQDDLVEALATGVIRQAALDVTYPEPLPSGHPLLKLPNIIITPHFAGHSADTKRIVYEQHRRNLVAAIIDKVPMPCEIKR